MREILQTWSVLCAVLILSGGCVVNPISYGIPVTVTRPILYEYPRFKDQPSGIAVSAEGRIFVSFPRWHGNPSSSVAEALDDGTLRPFPDAEWNRRGGPEAGSPSSRFISAQGLCTDGKGTLWVLDAAADNRKGAVPGGAKLVGIDLASGRVSRVIPLDNAVLPGSNLRRVCVDTWGDHAYISDAGTGAILIVNLEQGRAWRALAEDPSTKAEPDVVLTVDGKALVDEGGNPIRMHVDGIALDPEGAFLYYHALSATILYRIHTRYLNDPAFAQGEPGRHVERLSETGPAAGLLMDREYSLFLAAPDENAIKRYRIHDGSLVTLARSDTISWPDSLALSPDRYLYVTASQFNRLPTFNRGKDERKPPYTLFRVSKTYPPPQ